ncbi:MAG: discoidin domain-containing protein [Polyangiaceae bacterium]
MRSLAAHSRSFNASPGGRDAVRVWLVPLLLILVTLFGLAGCKPAPQVPNLLTGISPSRIENVNHPERLTDGVRAGTGDNWDTDATSTFASPEGLIEFDLGSKKDIRAIYVQGDNNDEYIFSASDDGTQYRELWIAPPSTAVGMQSRSTGAVHAQARYVRITARGGDRYYSIGEVQLFSDARGLGGGSFCRRVARYLLRTPSAARS